MDYISEATYKNVKIPLIEKEYLIENKNIFSVIVGKNGSGKSTILHDLTRLLGETLPLIDDRNLVFPNKVIAVSTSPFDRFPVSHSKNKSGEKDRYHYIGMKNSGGRSSAITLISKATIGLISSIGAANNTLLNVFECMKLHPKITINWKAIDLSREKSVLSKARGKAEAQYDLYLSGLASTKAFPEAKLFIELLSDFKDYFNHEDIPLVNNLNGQELSELRYSLELFQSSGLESNVPSIDLNFIDGRMNFSNDSYRQLMDLDSLGAIDYNESQLVKAITILAKYNVLKINDIKISRKNDLNISLRRASSGEQCMLVIMFGIAGYLKDNSCVLIDEPEISLHPEWQEDFINLLMESFSHFKGCHFVIATHSPQIISKLTGDNCFAINLGANKIFSSDFFSKKSSDFQLAEIFDAPGLKNEYIIRVSFDLIAKIRSRKAIDEEINNAFAKLLELKDKLDLDDPVRSLIASVGELRSHYANN